VQHYTLAEEVVLQLAAQQAGHSSAASDLVEVLASSAFDLAEEVVPASLAFGEVLLEAFPAVAAMDVGARGTDAWC